MDLRLAGSAAFVAASSKGIGRESALRLAQEGARVTVSSRSEENTEAAREYVLDRSDADPADVLAVPCDVTDQAAVTDAIERTVDAFGGLDILVNNHGGTRPGAFEELTTDMWDHGYEQVVRSNVWLSQAALPHLVESDDGNIVTIASASSTEAPANHSLSNVFRLGLYGLTKTIAREYAPDVRANVLAPRYIMTGRIEYLIENRAETRGISLEESQRSRDDEVLLDRPGTPEEFADALAFLASPAAGYVTGTVLPVDGGWIQSVV